MGDHTLTPATTTVALPPAPAQYTKSLAFVVVAVLTAIVAALSDNVITTAELVQAVVAGAGAVAVYIVPNLAAGLGAYLKTFVAIATTAGTALVPILGEGGFGNVPTSAWLTVIITALGAVGVYIAPNAPAEAEVARDLAFDEDQDDQDFRVGPGDVEDVDPVTGFVTH